MYIFVKINFLTHSSLTFLPMEVRLPVVKGIPYVTQGIFTLKKTKSKEMAWENAG
jgi:hypothetical protein